MSTRCGAGKGGAFSVTDSTLELYGCFAAENKVHTHGRAHMHTRTHARTHTHMHACMPALPHAPMNHLHLPGSLASAHMCHGAAGRNVWWHARCIVRQQHRHQSLADRKQLCRSCNTTAAYMHAPMHAPTHGTARHTHTYMHMFTHAHTDTHKHVCVCPHIDVHS